VQQSPDGFPGSEQVQRGLRPGLAIVTFHLAGYLQPVLPAFQPVPIVLHTGHDSVVVIGYGLVVGAGIDQGSVESFMPQKLLDRGDPAARVEELGGAGMSETVSVDRNPGSPGAGPRPHPRAQPHSHRHPGDCAGKLSLRRRRQPGARHRQRRGDLLPRAALQP